jgi:membrane protein required for colicin V production
MNLLDAALVLVALVSVIGGAIRGFAKEAAALAGWVLATVLVLGSAADLGRHLPFEAGSAGVHTAIAAGLIVLVCILAAHLAGRLLRAALAAVQLGGPDRALGALFGVVRAGAIGLLVAAMVMHLGLSQSAFWKSSRLAPWLEAALRLLPSDFAIPTHRPMAAPGV